MNNAAALSVEDGLAEAEAEEMNPSGAEFGGVPELAQRAEELPQNDEGMGDSRTRYVLRWCGAGDTGAGFREARSWAAQRIRQRCRRPRGTAW